ncbi:NAD(P)/FAD-dependent oxidoreductase [Rhodococcus tibetensis]|uniref:NAD(P)/FAD-dependent oxidoreductase n=1 Tax=Rhodococcus tibetensis TaxID=2965064 RepID=UPI0035AB88C6
MDSAILESPPWVGYEEASSNTEELNCSPTFDRVVIGAGLVGMATAVELLRREPQASIAILEIHAPTAGASGRGTGLVGPRIGPAIDVLERRVGNASALRSYRASEQAVELTTALCSELGVPWNESTQYVVARTAAEQRTLFAQASTYRRLGIDVRMCTQKRLAHETSAPQFGGLEYQRAATVDPALLTGALARRAKALGAHVYHRTPVSEIDNFRGRVRVQTGQGPVFARSVVVATNTPTISSIAQRVGAVVGLEVFGALTVQSEDTELIGATGRAFVGADSLAPFHLTRADGSTIIGGGGARSRPAKGSRKAFDLATWDWLAQWWETAQDGQGQKAFSHRWSGPIAVTGDGLPVVGPVAGLPDVWFMGGCGGHGLAMAAFNAAVIASSVTSSDSHSIDLPWLRSRAPGPAASRPVSVAVGALVHAKTMAMRRSQANAVKKTGERPIRTRRSQ